MNDGKYALDPRVDINKQYVHHEAWLLSALEELDSIDSDARGIVRSTRKDAVKAIQEELNRFENLKAEEWTRQDVSQSRTRAVAAAGGIEVIDTSKVPPDLCEAR